MESVPLDDKIFSLPAYGSPGLVEVIPEPISSDPWQNVENQLSPTLSVISDRSELSVIAIICQHREMTVR